MKRFALPVIVLLILSAQIGAAQNGNLICTHNSSAMGGYCYATLDLLNDTLVDHTLLPGYIANGHGSTTVDTANSIYYISDGVHIYGVNTLTDSLVLSMVFPLSGTLSLTCIQYNSCDGSIYGIIVDFNGEQATSVDKFNPQDSTITVLAPVSGDFHFGGQGTIDPVNNIYMFELGASNQSIVGGYDIALGALSFYSPLSAMNPSILFRGISYDCINARLLGLEINQSSQEIYLSSVDVLSTNLTHISSSPISNNLYFNAGGICMNHNSATFYYTPVAGIINSFDVNGNLMADTIQPSNFFGIESMTACPCPAALNINNQAAPEAIMVYPNPAQNTLTIDNSGSGTLITIRNILGECVYNGLSDSGSMQLDVSNWKSGIYVVHSEGYGGSSQSVFVKE